MNEAHPLPNYKIKRDESDLPLLLKALGHPSRVSIIEHLAKHTKCCGGDICGCLDLAQSTISQHLEILKKSGLVEAKTCGTKTMFKLNRELLFQVGDTLQIISKTTCC